MKTNMKLIIVAVIAIFTLSSCGPVRYSIDLEKKVDPEYKVDFGHSFPGVVALSQTNGEDSVILTQIAIGIAEKFEEEYSFPEGSIPIYSIVEDMADINDPAAVNYLHKAVGTDVLIILSSFSVGDFDVIYSDEKAYYNNQYLDQIIVDLPYNLTINVFKTGAEKSLAAIPVRDRVDWLLYSQDKVSEVKAIDNIREKILPSFKEIGVNAVSYFTPRWIKDTKDLFVYDNERWTDAFEFAYMFQWDKAMDIWMEEAQKSNTEKAACAAYNLSVACDVLGMEELSKDWRKRYDNFNK